MRDQQVFLLATLAFSVAAVSCGTADSVDAVQGVRNGATIETGVDTCPSFSFYMVLPKQIRAGEVATAIAMATDAQSPASDLTYTWSATSGAFSRTDTSVTEYSCGSPGAHVLRVTAANQKGCSSALTLDVECAAP